MTTIDLSLASPLYEGCEIKEISGRLTLVTPSSQAKDIVGRNAYKIVRETEDRSSVTLTGPMAVWAYLVVFHVVVHSFREVYYDDGRSEPILVAAHY